MRKYTSIDIFTRYLADQLSYHIAKREGMEDRVSRGERVETPPAWQKLNEELSNIEDELKQQGEYFHTGGRRMAIWVRRRNKKIVEARLSSRAGLSAEAESESGSLANPPSGG